MIFNYYDVQGELIPNFILPDNVVISVNHVDKFLLDGSLYHSASQYNGNSETVNLFYIPCADLKELTSESGGFKPITFPNDV